MSLILGSNAGVLVPLRHVGPALVSSTRPFVQGTDNLNTNAVAYNRALVSFRERAWPSQSTSLTPL